MLYALATLTVLASGSATRADATLDEVIAKHIAAHGGMEAWSQVESWRATGDYTAFSKVAPFTLTRSRGNRYLLDTAMNGHKVVIGHDGEASWWDNHFFQEGAQKINGLDAQVAAGDAHFVTPLFNYSELGMTAEYLGTSSFEGMPALAIKLIRPDDAGEEVWYLDPETFLEAARTSPGSDFGRPQEQRTFYDDFRKVGAVTLPFYVETQWYTRDRVMVIDKIELNVDVAEDLYTLPAPIGMGELLPMAGKWKVAAKRRNQPGAPWEESEYEAEVNSSMGNRLLRANFTPQDGVDVEWTLSYDPHRSAYRMTVFVSTQGYMDVMEGGFDEGGTLVLGNLETGTSLNVADLTIFGRVHLSDISADGFKMNQEVTMDGGESWMSMSEETFTRQDD
jgi:hypothetical protein